MSTPLFVCGMLRSGTSLIQTLLTNHPNMLVAYQPFHQLYVDVKQRFFDEHGIDAPLPLDDGAPGNRAQRELFLSWLASRRFDAAEAGELASRATAGKGGGLSDRGSLSAPAGTFIEIRQSLHGAMAQGLGRGQVGVVGSKEILCEEYVPALLAAGVRCVLILRDPRAVIASANNGRYRDMVGDRYPLMMLIRLWRKTAAYWLHYRHHPLVRAIRYEDLIADPDSTLQDLADWLGLEPFPPDLIAGSLKDHAGRPWRGNSSFGDKTTIDASTHDKWRELLAADELRFIGACLRQELEATGYPLPAGLGEQDILAFEENIRGVRPAHLARHAIDNTTRRDAIERLALSPASNNDLACLGRHFLFPEGFARPPNLAPGSTLDA
ncbi:MAG: sulfotransferase [Lysobacter sp.]